MENGMRTILIPALIGLLLASCGSTKQTGSVSDDIYYAPSKAVAEVPTTTKSTNRPAQEVTAPQAKDDYYDAGTAQQYAQPRGFYDMTYNDPYYYNYGRFGFNSGYGSSLAFQSGWFMGPGGYPSQWGYGTGVYSGWFRPGISFGVNYGYPYGGGWNQFGAYNDPYYGGWGNGFGYGYGSGYGYGNYYGPYGQCPYYSPIVVGGSSNTVVGHRPSVGSRNGASTSGGTVGSTRAQFRDPVGLMPSVDRSSGRSISSSPNIRDGSRGATVRPSRTSPVIERGGRQSTNGRTPSVTQPRSSEGRGVLRSNGGSEGRGVSSPSRSGGSTGGGGGGTRPSAPNRAPR